jgi:hypothetical protein
MSPLVGDQLGAYVEVMVIVPSSNGQPEQRFVLWGDTSESDGVEDLCAYLQPESVEVTYGLSLIPEVKFAAFVPWMVMAEVLDSNILNSLGSLWVRFVGTGGMASPWWGGITVDPDVSIGDGGANVTFNSKGVSVSLSQFGLKKEFHDCTVEYVVNNIFSALSIGPERYVFEADKAIKLTKPYVFDRPSLWDNLCVFLAEYGMVIVDEIQTGSDPTASNGVSKFYVRQVKALTYAVEKVVLRYMPGGQIGDMGDGTVVLPILSFSYESKVLFAPGFGDALVVTVDRETHGVSQEKKAADKDSHPGNKGGKQTVASSTITMRGLADKLSSGTLSAYGFRGTVIPEVKDTGTKGGGAEKASVEVTKDLAIAGFEVEIETIGSLIRPGDMIGVDGLCKKLNGRYWVKTLVQTGGSGAWGTKLGCVKFGDDSEINGVDVEHNPSRLADSSTGDAEKQPTEVGA